MDMSGLEALGLHFPVSAEVPESTWHLRLRTLVYLFLKHAFEEVAIIGSDQFVYWDPTNPKACLAPDAFVRFGNKNEDFGCWKAWERGAPHVAVEIISDSDAAEGVWQDKLDRYRRLGVSELVRFDARFPEQPLRIWDFVGDDLLERRLFEPCALSRHLGGYWLAVEAPNGDLNLRLSRDERGLRLFPTPEEFHAAARWAEVERRQLTEQALKLESEARRRESEARQRESEARQRETEARQRETEARQRETEALRRAEARIAELEAELRQKS